MASTFRIPTSYGADALPFYQLEVELDGVPYRIDLIYNSRQGCWFANLRDANGVLLRAGIPVVSGFPLLLRMRQRTRPAGRIVATSIAGNIDAAGLEQLGRDVILTYTGET